MAVRPNNRLDGLAFAPYRFTGAASGTLAYVSLAGSRFNPNTNANYARTASIPDGYAPHGAATPPIKAGGMSSWQPTSATMSGTASLLSGGPIEGTGSMSLSGTSDLGLTITLAGTGTMTLDGTSNLALTIALAGTWFMDWSGTGNLSIIDPLSASFSMSFTGVADLRGNLSMAGEFRNSEDTVTVDYGGQVHVAEFGSDGFSFPFGTATNPVATIACADFLANKYSLRTYNLNGTYVLAKAYTHTTFTGGGPVLTCIIVNPGYALEDCLFERVTLAGAGATSNCQIIEGVLSGYTGWHGLLSDSAVTDTITIAGQLLGRNVISLGASNGSTQTAWIDFGGATGVCRMTVDGGDFGFRNVTNAVSLVTLTANRNEKISFASTCTSAITVPVTGVFRLDDLSGPNFTVVSQDPANTAWEEELEGTRTAGDLMRVMSAVLAGKSSGQPSSPVFRSVDDTADRVTATVDEDGNRTSVTLDP